MKNQFRHLAVAIGLSAVLGSALLIAQSNRGIANVPFEFQVQDRALPAGTYTVQEATASGVIMLRNEETGKAINILAPVPMSATSGDSKLVFNRYGDRYFLSQVWLGGDVGHGLYKSHLEKEMASAKTPAVLASIRVK